MTILKWSGRDWVIADSSYGLEIGYKWNPNVFVDANNWLHLNLEKKNGIWYAPMIYDSVQTGYGTYRWILKGMHALDKNAVLGLFAYAWDHQHELDIEQAQWGSASNPTWGFAVQPSQETGLVATHTFSPDMPTDNDIVCTIVWTPTGETFSMYDKTAGKMLREWSSAIPVNAELPLKAKAFVNLYPRTKEGSGWTASVLPDTNQSYIIKSFTFTPPGGTVPPLEAPAVEPPVVVPPVVVPPVVDVPFVPVPTVLPEVEIRRDIITSAIGGAKVLVKRNDEDWAEFAAPYVCKAGDLLTFCAIDAKGNVGPDRTVYL